MDDGFSVAFNDLLIAMRFCEAHLSAELAQALVIRTSLQSDEVEDTETSLEFHAEKVEFYGGEVRRRADLLREAFWRRQREATHEAALLEDAEREGAPGGAT